MRLIFLIFLLVYSTVGFAGKRTDHSVCTFEYESIQAAGRNTLLTNTLLLNNIGNDTVSYRILSCDPSVRIFNTTPGLLAPGSSKKQLLKFSLPGNCLYSGYKAGVWCISASGDTLCAAFTISVASQHDVQVYPTDPAPLIDNNTAQNISLVVRNKGNAAEQLKLHIAGGQQVPDILFALPPYTDTSFSVALTALLHNHETPPQSLVATLYDSSGQPVSVADIHPRLVYNTLQLQPGTAPAADNFASVQYSTNNTGNSYREYQLSYNRNAVANGLILAAYAFDGAGMSAPNISNSYIGYRKDNVAVRLGLLNLWGELPVYGQGGNITLGDNRRYISTSYLHNGNAYLSNETRGPDNETKNIHAAFGYDVSGRLYTNGMFLRQWQNLFNKDMYMGGLSMQWQAGKNNMVEASVYGNTGETAIGHTQGAAAHLRWTGKGKRWQLFSDNYMSSPEYAGILKDTKQFSESLTWRMSEKENAAGISLTGNYVHSDPAVYDDKLQRISNLQVNEQYGIGIFKSFSRLLLRVSPYYSRQQAQYGNSDFYTLTNWYTRLDAQYNHKAFSASINMTAALQQQQNGIKSNMVPVRIQAFFQYKYFTLQGLYQYRPFFATDLQQEMVSGKVFSLASVSPGLRAGLLHGHLDVFANYNLQYFNGNITPMQYVFAGAVASVFTNWQLSASYACTINNFYTYQDIRVGVRFLFRRPADVFTHRKTMIFFSDENHNGKRDATEKTVPGVLVGAEPALARTDANGSIRLLHYKNNVPGLSLVNGNGYTPAADMSSYRFDKKKIYVPMYRMGIVSGKLKLLLPRYSKQNITITGLPLIFTDENDNTITCYVQSDGGFSVSLPSGHYHISIAQAMADIYQLQQAAAIDVDGKDVQQLTLEVKYSRAQPVETIQFSGKR